MVVYMWLLADISSMLRNEPDSSLNYYAERLAHRLRLLRLERDFTQEYVAHSAGISTYTYQKFEKGESKPGTPMNPRLSTLISLSNVFDVDVCDLLDFSASQD